MIYSKKYLNQYFNHFEKALQENLNVLSARTTYGCNKF